MNVWSDLKRALRPAELTDGEWRGLRTAIERLFVAEGQARPRPGDNVEIPSVTAAGKAYLLTLKIGVGGIRRFEVDHDPDLSSPAFEAYVDKRVEWDREAVERKGEK